MKKAELSLNSFFENQRAAEHIVILISDHDVLILNIGHQGGFPFMVDWHFSALSHITFNLRLVENDR